MTRFAVVGRRNAGMGRLIAALVLVFVSASIASFAQSYGWGYFIRVTSPSGGSTYTQGNTMSISWYADYDPAFAGATYAIDYSADNANWTNVTSNMSAYTYSYSWSIPSTVPPGRYWIRVREVPNNNNGWYNSFNDPGSVYPVTILRGCFPPTITQQPQSRTVCVNTSTTFTVASDMTQGTYVWRKDGNTVATTTTNSYTIPSVQTSHAGSYDVVLTDACSTSATRTSAIATLTVNLPPAITTQPVTAVTICESGSALLSVRSTGVGRTFQWYKDGAAINGARDSNYLVDNAQPATSGLYTVTITGTCAPPVTSTACTVSVTTKPRITEDPQSIVLCPGTNGQISVTATGSNLSYQWYKNGAVLGGASQPTLPFVAYANTMDGQYYCVVKNNAPNPANCIVTTQSRTVTVAGYRSPTVTTQPVATEGCIGKALTLTSEFSGFGLQYVWTRNGAVVPNANSNVLTIPMVKASDAGTYRVTATGTCNLSASSMDAVVTVVSPPTFTTQPVGRDLEVGQTLTLTVAGNDVRTVQWTKNGAPIPGANTTTYTVQAVTKADAGYYTAVVTNACASATSGNARVTVMDPAAQEPRLTMSKTGEDFGDLPVGYPVSRDLTNLIQNTGVAPLTISDVSIPGTDFTIENPRATPYVLQPNEYASVTVRANAQMVGNGKVGTLTVTSNAPSPTGTVNLTSNVVLRYDLPSSFAFADTREDSTRQQCFTVTNNSAVPVTIESITSGGVDPTLFSVVTAVPLAIPANGSVELCLRFAPGSVGDKAASLLFTSASGGNSSMLLSGRGTVMTTVDDDALASRVSVYPNPATDAVTIKAPEGASVTIINAQGARVASLNVSGGTGLVRWNTRDMNGSAVGAGSYTIVIKTSTATANLQVAVVR